MLQIKRLIRATVLNGFLATAVGAATPNALTTYVGTYGVAPAAFAGPSQTLALRVYAPQGIATVNWLNMDLGPANTPLRPEYYFYLLNNGGAYQIYMADDKGHFSSWPFLTISPNGVSTPVNLAVGNLTLTSYRFAFAGNELQLDLDITRSDTFTSQIVLAAQAGAAYSSPFYGTAAALWTSSAAPPFIPSTSSHLTAVWANNGEDKVTRDELRATNGAAVVNSLWDGATVNLFAARNEVVAFNLLLEAGGGTADHVSVQFQSLTGPGGAIISSPAPNPATIFDWTQRNIEQFFVRYLPIRGISTFGYNSGRLGFDERQVPKGLQLPWTGPTGYIGATGNWTSRPNADKFYPEIAVPLELYPNGFTVNQGENQSIWTDIYVPSSAPPGTYTGAVSISENGSVTHTVPISLTVRGFTLPDTPSSKTMIAIDEANVDWRLTGVRYPNQNDPEDLIGLQGSNILRQIAHRHKVSLIGDNRGEVNDLTGIFQPSPRATAALTGALFTAASGYGGPGYGVGENVYSIGTYGTWQNTFRGPNENFPTQADMWTHTDGWERWFQTNAAGVQRFLYICDECDANGNRTPTEVNTWAGWVKANPGIGRNLKTFATTDFYNALAYEPNIDIAAGSTWAYIDSTQNYQLHQITQATVDSLRANGKTLFTYNPTHPGAGCFATEDDGVALREVPWAQYYKKLDRMFYWSANYWYNDQNNANSPVFTDLFNDAQTFGAAYPSADTSGRGDGLQSASFSNGDGVLFYPSYDAVLTSPAQAPYNSFGLKGEFASLRLKFWRRGIQDVDYITLANAVNPSATQAIVYSMLSANHTGPTAFWDTPDLGGWTIGDISWSIKANDWEAARKQLAHLIDGR